MPENKKPKKKLTVEEQPTQLTKAARAAGKKEAKTDANVPAKAPANTQPAIKRTVVPMDPDIPLRYLFAGLCAAMLLVFGCVFFADGGVILQWIVTVFMGLYGRNVYLISMPALVYLLWIQLASRNQRVRKRTVCIMLFVFFFGCLSHLMSGEASAQIGWELVKELYASGTAGSSGGVICGTVTELLVRGFGRFCTGALMLMGAVITILWAAKIRLRDVYHAIINLIRNLIERARDRRDEIPEYEDYAEEEEEEEYIDPFSRWMDSLAKKREKWGSKKFPDPRLLAEKLSISERNRQLLEEDLEDVVDEYEEQQPDPVAVIPAEAELRAEIAAEPVVNVVPKEKEKVSARDAAISAAMVE